LNPSSQAPDWAWLLLFAPSSRIFRGTFCAGRAFIMAMTDVMYRTPTQGPADVNDREDLDTDLIRRACSDRNAFAELYLRHYAHVFHYCIRRLFDRNLAEDVTSTVFFKAMHNLRSFNGDATGLRSWLLRITTNAVNDHLREARRRAKLMERAAGDGDPAAMPDDELAERKALLRQALLSLKPQYQTVITLRFFENMKLTEIAECLGEKPSTIRTWLWRATAKLRRKLDAAAGGKDHE
jgi:RNA polymerase sigma-70 factor (ECF subfamily)